MGLHRDLKLNYPEGAIGLVIGLMRYGARAPYAQCHGCCGRDAEQHLERASGGQCKHPVVKV